MQEMLKVDDAEIEKARISHKKMLSSPDYNFYETLKAKDSEAIGMLSRGSFEAATSLEDFLSTFSAVRECTERYLVSRGLEKSLLKDDFNAFLNMYSAYAGIVEGRLALNREKDERTREKTPMDFLNFRENEGEAKVFLESIIFPYRNLVKKDAASGKKRKEEINIIYNTIEDKILREKSRYPLLEAAVSEIVLSVNSSRIRGFSSASPEEAEEKREIDKNSENYMNFEKIIGNSEAKSALKKYADMLFLYDAKTRKNPVSESTHIPRTVFMYARPGTGKTSIASAARNYMSELSEKTGKKFSWVPIDSSIKKKWYGETEEILKSKVEKAMNPDNIGVIFIDDIDGLVISRSDESSNAPDKSMTIYLMQLIEGIDTPYYGNYMIISASNKPGDLDEALIERIGEASFKVPGPKTKGEYSEFLKMKLEKGIQSGYVRIGENEWGRAAELCMKYSEELSPRDLTKAMRMLQDEALRESALEGLCNLPYSEQKKRINSGFERIGINELTAAIENRYNNEMSQREVTYESDIKKIKERLVKEKKAIEIAAKEIAGSEKNGNA